MRKFEGFDKDYDKEPIGEGEGTNFIDSDREYPLETRCCVTGEEVKHSFCRYPDPIRGTMMVMSHEVMLAFSRTENSLPQQFEQILDFRRKKEGKAVKTT